MSGVADRRIGPPVRPVAAPRRRGPGLRVTIGLVGLLQTGSILATMWWLR